MQKKEQNNLPDLGTFIMKSGFGSCDSISFENAIISEIFYAKKDEYFFTCEMKFEDIKYAGAFNCNEITLFDLFKNIGNEDLMTLVLGVFFVPFTEPQQLVLQDNEIITELECKIEKPKAIEEGTIIPFIVDKFINPKML